LNRLLSPPLDASLLHGELPALTLLLLELQRWHALQTEATTTSGCSGGGSRCYWSAAAPSL